MDKTIVKIKSKQGDINEFDVLFTVNSDETKKDYIVYTDNTRDEVSNIKAYAASYNNEGKLYQIKEPREWNALEELINKFNKEDE